MTKRQARRERQAEWNRAIREGRLVRFVSQVPQNGHLVDQIVMRAYGSPAAAQVACDAANEDGGQANIVDPALALEEL